MSTCQSNSTSQHEVLFYFNFRPGRKSIATISLAGSCEQPIYNNYNSNKLNMTKDNVFLGIGK